MINNSTLEYYRLIGRIQKAIAHSDNLREALRESLSILTERIPSDQAIVWYVDEDEENKQILRPYYWIGDQDITSRSHTLGSGTAGIACLRRKAVRNLHYIPGSDPETEEDFPGMPIRSVICVPVSCGEKDQCCIQLISTETEYSEELADTLEILGDMIAINAGENENSTPNWNFNRVLLSARGITKSYKNGDSVTQVLKGINLDIYEGEFLVILGESGCGKSSFLNIIGGLDLADSGTITFNGKLLPTVSGKGLAKYRRENTGFIFQSYNLMPNLTAKQNLTLIGELVPEPMDADDALSLVGLSEKKDNYPFELSGGQQQRVSIARALVKKPRIIFADEPTAALDYATSIEVLSVLENVIHNGTSLVMVTHNEEIARMADRVIRIRQGKITETLINRRRAAAEELSW